MHRRPIGRDRALAAAGAVIVLIGCVLPWWTVGGASGLPARSGNAFESYGILVFVAALATLAVVTLPYATDRPVPTDRWISYAIVCAVGWLGFALRIVDLALVGAFAIHEPVELLTRMPGVWVVGIGLAVLSRGAYDLARAPSSR